MLMAGIYSLKVRMIAIAKMDIGIVDLVVSQFRQIKKGGVAVLVNKIFKLLLLVHDALLFIPALFIVFIFRIFSPWVRIRFGCIDAFRIGHFVLNVHLYLYATDNKATNGPRVFDIFYFRGPISNKQLAKMWKKVLFICPYVNLLSKANSYLNNPEIYTVGLPDYVRGHEHYAGIPPYLSFSYKEENFGLSELKKMGIPKGAPFVCFHVRDPIYLKKIFPLMDWDYHNYRDVNIKNCIPAMEELTRQGYYVVRMGAMVREPLDISNKRIIDYAVHCRSDFMDIYLSAKCKFFIGSGSGIDEVPKAFQRPVMYINFPIVSYIFKFYPIRMIIPKKLWLKNSKRFLTLTEILRLGIVNFKKTKQFEDCGIELIENSPDEITAAVMELEARLKGSWRINEEDEKLQDKFRSLFKEGGVHEEIITRIGTEFLGQNKYLLE